MTSILLLTCKLKSGSFWTQDFSHLSSVEAVEKLPQWLLHCIFVDSMIGSLKKGSIV